MEYDPNSALLRATDIARILNISRALAYQLMQRGEIRTVRIGAARRVRRQDLQKYIQENLSPTVNAGFIQTDVFAAPHSEL